MLSEKTPTNSTLARTSSKDNSIMPSFMSSNSSTTVNGGSCCKKKKKIVTINKAMMGYFNLRKAIASEVT